MARVFKRGRKWWIEYHTFGRKYRESAGPSKRDAERALAKRQTEIAEGRFLEKRKPCVVTLAEFRPRYLEWAKQHKRSWERDARSLAHLVARLGNLNLERITLADVERYRRDRLSGVLSFGGCDAGDSTVNRELACLRKVLNLAVDMRVLSENRLAGKIKLAKEPEGRVKYLKPAQAELLLSKCPAHIKPIVLLAMLTGMRRSELLGLRWEEVDLARGVVKLPGERTKNGRARNVPLSAKAKDVLREVKASRLDGCEWVFHREDGSPMVSIRTAWENARAEAKRAAKEAGGSFPEICFHDLRHCFASSLAIRGVPLQAIGELLGHRTLAMTQRYAHLSPQMLQGAVEQASAYLEDRAPEGVVQLAAEGSAEGAAKGAEGGVKAPHTGHKTGTPEKIGEVVPLAESGVG